MKPPRTQLSKVMAEKLLDQNEFEEWEQLQGDLRYLTEKKLACLRIKELEEEAARPIRIINSRFFGGKVLEEIAGEMGLSKERIRQIEGKAMRIMRHAANMNGKSAGIVDLLQSIDAAKHTSRLDLWV